MGSLKSVAEGMISLGTKVCPVWLRSRLFSFLFSLYVYIRRLKTLAFQLRLPVYMITGLEKTSGEHIRFLFVGRKTFPFFLNDLFFTSVPHVEQLGKVSVWRLQKLNCFFSFDIDAVLVSCDKFYLKWLLKADMYVYPHLVDMILDCSPGSKQIFNDLSRDTEKEIKKVKKHGYSFEITSDINKISMFYYDMYLPTVSNRIGKTDMYIPSFLSLRYLCEMGYKLMLVVSEGKYVCGGFFYHNKDVLVLKYSGVLNGNVDYIKKRAHSAVYYFLILFALDRQIKKIDFGGARPFFYNGLFRYKKKWGMMVKPSSLVPEVFGLQIVNNIVMRRFLIHNPFIGISENNELIGYVFVDKKTFNDGDKKRYETLVDVPGVSTIRFIQL